MSTFCRRSCEFQSTLPHGSDRERTQRHAAHGISIHAPSRERQGLLQLLAIGAGISIHAPSRERHYSAGSAVCCIYFNPRSLAGATLSRVQPHQIAYIFQSTLPCGSDAQCYSLPSFMYYFNPRSLAGATISEVLAYLVNSISIHAPLRERLFSLVNRRHVAQFQSTLPCGSDRWLVFVISRA